MIETQIIPAEIKVIYNELIKVIDLDITRVEIESFENPNNNVTHLQVDLKEIGYSRGSVNSRTKKIIKIIEKHIPFLKIHSSRVGYSCGTIHIIFDVIRNEIRLKKHDVFTPNV